MQTYVIQQNILAVAGTCERLAKAFSGYHAIRRFPPNGRTFLMLKSDEPEGQATRINVVLNCFEELNREVPASKKQARDGRLAILRARGLLW